MNWQLFVAFGILLGFTANLLAAGIGPLSWRFQMASAFLPALCLIALIWAIPESPRWLLKKGRLPEAFAALALCRHTQLEAAIELLYANAQLQAEISLLPKKHDEVEVEAQSEAPHQRPDTLPRSTAAEVDGETDKNKNNVQATVEEAVEQPLAKTSRLPLKEDFGRAWRKLTSKVDDSDMDQFQLRMKSTSYWLRVWQLWRDKRTKRAAIAALVVMISQQLCGV